MVDVLVLVRPRAKAHGKTREACSVPKGKGVLADGKVRWLHRAPRPACGSGIAIRVLISYSWKRCPISANVIPDAPAQVPAGLFARHDDEPHAGFRHIRNALGFVASELSFSDLRDPSSNPDCKIQKPRNQVTEATGQHQPLRRTQLAAFRFLTSWPPAKTIPVSALRS